MKKSITKYVMLTMVGCIVVAEWIAQTVFVVLVLTLFVPSALTLALLMWVGMLEKNLLAYMKSTRHRVWKAAHSLPMAEVWPTYSQSYVEGSIWIDEADGGSDSHWFRGNGYYKWED